jgi:solute:Na+ symporter, SSS family
MRYFDLAVIIVYLIGITWFGAQFRSSQKSLKDYFLGGRKTPWWAISFSIVSAETSTLTVIGTPALAFTGNLGFLQVVFGYLLARIVITVLFLPQYFRGEMYTAYELMDRRFGPRIRKLTAGLFLVLRALAEGVRVFAISIVISIVLDTGELASILLIVALTLFYTFEGGMTAVIWTDVVQMFLYVAGAILSFFVILGEIPGGWSEVVRVAGETAKFQIFDFSLGPPTEFFSRTYTFWAGVIGGCFLTTASHGTEQLLVQRLLSARNQAESRRALLGSWVVIFFQFTLFLVIGVILFVYYQKAQLPAPEPLDRIYPDFVWNHLPVGVAGLVTAAILAAAMSNLSAALNSLASTTVMDFYRPFEKLSGRPQRSDADLLKLGRGATVVWGLVLVGISLLARQWGSVLEAGLSVASVLYGALLGVFLLGMLAPRVGERAAMAGMLAGFLTMIYVKFGTSIAWTWYVVIGTLVTFSIGWASAFLLKENRNG